MKAIEFTEPKKITVIDRPDAGEPKDDEAVVRSHRMGICGTDLSCFLGKFPFFSYPRIPGHELGVEVVAVGKNVQNVKPGDKCSLEPYVNNPSSTASQKGASNCCPDVQVIGVHNDGGLRQGTFIVPARKLHPGNDLSYDQLALVETLAIGYHAVQRGNPQPGETVLVIGAGPIGLSCLEFLKLIPDISVIVMDQVAGRLDFCSQHLGIHQSVVFQPDGSHLEKILAMTHGQGADMIIDATGNPNSMSSCLEYAAHTGRVVYVGITTSNLVFPHAPVFHRRELTLMASRNALPSDFPKIIDLIRSGKINTDVWITHRIAFDDVPDGFEPFTHPDRGTIKAMIEIQ
jgi:2-desacetyl-2-hydroxyethyl bacteriochlorophyllide A dehydrogenase